MVGARRDLAAVAAEAAIYSSNSGSTGSMLVLLLKEEDVNLHHVINQVKATQRQVTACGTTSPWRGGFI